MATTTWTREQTTERRESWNAAVKSGAITGKNGKTDMAKLTALQSRLGFTHQQLADAVRHHDLDGKRAALEATPEYQRSRLINALEDAVERSERTFARMHASEDALAWSAKVANDQVVDTARAALRAFDAEHPEVLAAIKAERAAEVARRQASPNWMWD